MYVCLCHAISDRQIREAVNRGAGSLREVQAHLPVATCCGCCAETVRQIIDSQVDSQVDSQAAGGPRSIAA